MTEDERFVDWFRQATGYEPYPYQAHFACDPTLPQLVDVPTGLGKTAMAVLGWLWRQRFGASVTRRRRGHGSLCAGKPFAESVSLEEAIRRNLEGLGHGF